MKKGISFCSLQKDFGSELSALEFMRVGQHKQQFKGRLFEQLIEAHFHQLHDSNGM